MDSKVNNSYVIKTFNSSLRLRIQSFAACLRYWH